ncbi:uncharacterized protein LOC120658543 [Panicum virgatum]|uniref:Lipase-like protein n=1 Tax=Panicum virgatum TaxID=38727 RepID=A0A8T0VTG6_PANVG|nr:uncharacterized protein LOC120658543 [Panicum virgatum]KAG2638105.1 hypothetical protein PVAP13_2NG571400 [Panicum virgatum]
MEKERKQGFFAVLKEEVVRGLSPARSRGKSPAPARSASPPEKVLQQYLGEQLIARSGSLRPGGEALAPLIEGPDAERLAAGDPDAEESGRREGFGNWVRGHLTRTPSMASAATGPGGSGASFRRSDLRLLLGVMGAPLAPIPSKPAEPLPLLSIKGTPIESSSAQYILHQYTAASGGYKLLQSVRNAYAMGKVRMVASEFETATRVVKNRGPTGRGAAAVEQGGFVLWQMAPDMWYVELAVGGSKVHAGSNGRLVWRHTPWLGAHAAKGPVRPLRRVLQGLDPLTTAGLFAEARCVGEKKVNGEDCFILKLTADPQTLKLRSEGPAEIIRHVLFGYFSQRTGLLVQIEDSHLTRIQPHAGGDAVYWETTISSALEDYRPVEGIMIAHSGRSAVTLFRFGEAAMSHTKTRMEEAWSIEEVAFNVPGLSMDCFIPPADIRSGSVGEACELPSQSHGERARIGAVHPSRVAAMERAHAHPHPHSANASVAGAGGRGEKIMWRVEV